MYTKLLKLLQRWIELHQSLTLKTILKHFLPYSFYLRKDIWNKFNADTFITDLITAHTQNL